MKKVSIQILFFLLFFFTGCGKKVNYGEGDKEIPAPTLPISELFQSENQSDTVDGDLSNILSEELEKIDETGLASYNAANRMLKHDTVTNQNSLFCIDGDTGAVYFINQKQDYYIYRLKEGVAELAVAIPARELYCYNGILYFMVDAYEQYELQGMKNWDIYAYNPVEGTVELVYGLGSVMEQGNTIMLAEMFQRMMVNEEGIYFIGGLKEKQVENNGKVYNTLEQESLCLPFGAKEPVEDDRNMTWAGWKDYYFAYIPVEGGGYHVALNSRESNKAVDKIIIGETLQYFLIENDVYFLSNQKIMKFNLLTGEKTEYDCESAMRRIYETVLEQNTIENIQLPQLTAFTITEDSIWAFNAQKYVFQFNRNSGEVVCYKLETNKVVDTVYTDGHSIYALTQSGVAKIVTEATEKNGNGISVLEVEVLVKE